MEDKDGWRLVPTYPNGYRVKWRETSERKGKFPIEEAMVIRGDTQAVCPLSELFAEGGRFYRKSNKIEGSGKFILSFMEAVANLSSPASKK